MFEPLLFSIDHAVAEIFEVKKKLKSRQDLREMAKQSFFAQERAVCKDMEQGVLEQCLRIEALVEKLQAQVKTCDGMMGSEEVQSELLADHVRNQPIMYREERVDIAVPFDACRFALQQHMSAFSPKHNSAAKVLLKHLVETHKLGIEANIRAYIQMKDLSHEEKKDLDGFDTNLATYQKMVWEFSMILVTRRRQRAIQLNIKLRKARIEEMRTTR